MVASRARVAVCARDADRAASRGRSTSSLGLCLMKHLARLLCLLLVSTSALAEDLFLLRKDADETSYYEPHTVRRTGQLVMAWVVTFKQDRKDSEYLTEFDCKRATYRQLALRVFASNSEVSSSDAVYVKWFAVPSSSQILGLLFKRVCGP